MAMNVQAQIKVGNKFNGVMLMDMKMNGMGQKIKVKTSYYFVGKLIAENTDQTKEWEMVVDSLTMIGDGKEDELINFNSNTSEVEDDEKLARLKEMVGKKKYIIVDANGDIKPKTEDGENIEFAKMCFIPMPANKRKVGDTWLDTKDMETNGMKVNTKTTYKITKVNNQDITITSTSILKNKMMKLDPVISTYTVDANTSLVKQASTATKMRMMKMLKMEIIMNYKGTW
jgi:hypothetical protein